MGEKHKSDRLRAKAVRLHASPGSARLEDILGKQWFALGLMAALSILYFISIFLKDVTFFAAEAGVLAYKKFGWGTGFINPFAEDALWYNMYLGGLPGAQGLVEYTHFIIKNFLCMFVTENIECGIYYILMIFASGWGMYIYLSRALGLHRIAALIVAIAYMFAPSSLSLTYAGHLSKMGVHAILPFQFYFLEKGMETGRFRNFLYLGGTIALSIGTAHLQYAYLALWGLALYGVFRLLGLLRNRLPVSKVALRGVFLALAAVIGLGICARAYIPQYIHTSQVSKRAVADQDQAAGKAFASSWSLHPEEVASLVIPEFVGYNLQNEGQYYWGRNPFKINAEYFGVIIVILAIGGMFIFARNGYVQFFGLLFGFAVLYALAEHTPLFGIGYSLIPGMKYVRGLSFFALLFVFSAMVVAAFALNWILLGENARDRSKWKLWYWITGFFAGTGLLVTVAGGRILNLWIAVLYNGIPDQKKQAMLANLGEVREGGLLLFFLAGLTLLILYAYQRNKINGALFGVALIALVVFDSWRIDKQFLLYVPASNLKLPAEQKIPAYEFLKANDATQYRVLPLHALNNLRFGYEGINLVTGFNDFTLLRYHNVLNNKIMKGLAQGDLMKPLLDLLCTKYFVHNGQDLNLAGIPVVYNQNDWYIYENPQAFPYMYFADTWQMIPDEERVLSILETGGIDAVRIPLIEKEPPAGFSAFNDSTGSGVELGRVEMINRNEYSAGKLAENIFAIDASRSGLFVFSENYHPSWHAVLDGEEIPIYRVNYLWRGVFVPEGQHSLEFQFRSLIIIRSCLVSSIFLIGFLVALGAIIIVPRIKRNP